MFDGGSGEVSGGKKTAKDSIMALYGSGSQQQMFGVPGKFSYLLCNYNKYFAILSRSFLVVAITLPVSVVKL